MRGPIEYLVDGWSKKDDKPTVDEVLRSSHVNSISLIEAGGKRIMGAGVLLSTLGGVMLLSREGGPLELNTNNDSFAAQEVLEFGINLPFNMPFIATTAGGMVLAAEGFSLWRRGQRRLHELEQTDV